MDFKHTTPILNIRLLFYNNPARHRYTRDKKVESYYHFPYDGTGCLKWE
jgi:hypothetical protein